MFKGLYLRLCANKVCLGTEIQAAWGKSPDKSVANNSKPTTALSTPDVLSNGGLCPVHIWRTMMVGGGSWPRCLCPENLEDSRKLLFCKRALHQMGRWGMRHGNVGQGERAGNNEPFHWSSLYRHMKLSRIKKLKRLFLLPLRFLLTNFYGKICIAMRISSIRRCTLILPLWESTKYKMSPALGLWLMFTCRLPQVVHMRWAKNNKNTNRCSTPKCLYSNSRMGQIHDEVIPELTLLQGDVGCSLSV